MENNLGSRQKKQESKAEKWCKEFERDCVARKGPVKSKDLEMRITGGRMADPKKNTFMVLIGYGTKTNRQWLCGGSLVSERYVLTAAHCTEGGTLGKAKWARVGELDLSTRKDDARPQDKDIVEWILHPEYKEPAVYNDIALLKLDSDVSFDEWVSPICLHTSKSLPGGPVTVAGWGRLDFASSTSPMLLEVEITLFNDTECVRLMGQSKDKMQFPRGIDTDTMICAGEIRGGKDACSGDSGGPLFFAENDCSTTQVGVTSMGRDCGLPNTAGIYTNVRNYVPWIESIVWADDN
ncbi:hypothetical protein GE061_016343 [Apolygus lucorum]|uniref:Uncharacterized protein n=1 Tax=Apolygus lucorum TaxID=248454 RepID=A0A6A4JM18_APOLU|nr:hypothetical protein GE061_016343 [Apolygus lucorum]